MSTTTTTDRLIKLLRERHEAGLAKYGTTVDRTDLTAEQWAQHAIEELLDGAAYIMRLKEEMEKREKRIAALEAHVARLDQALVAYVEAYTPDGHTAPHDCFSTGPAGGMPASFCPGCYAESKRTKAKEAKP